MLLEQIGKNVTGSVRVAQSEEFDRLGVYAALGQIGPRFRAARSPQAGAEGLIGQFVHLENGGAQPGVGVGEFRALGQRDTTAFGELLQGFIEADALDLLDKLEDIATLPAAKAFVELVVGVNA